MRNPIAIAALLLLGFLARDAVAADAQPRVLGAGEMLRGHFSQDRVLAGFAKPLHTEGSFVLVVGQGLIWQGEKPFKSTTIIAPAGILQLVNGEEAIRLPASRLPALSRFYQVLSGALSGDPSRLREDFRVERSGDVARWRLLLTPQRADDPALGQVQSIEISGPGLVDDALIRKAGGDLDHLRFLDQAVMPVALTAEETKLLAAVAQQNVSQ